MDNEDVVRVFALVYQAHGVIMYVAWIIMNKCSENFYEYKG